MVGCPRQGPDSLPPGTHSPWSPPTLPEQVGVTNRRGQKRWHGASEMRLEDTAALRSCPNVARSRGLLPTATRVFRGHGPSPQLDLNLMGDRKPEPAGNLLLDPQILLFEAATFGGSLSHSSREWSCPERNEGGQAPPMSR